MSIYPYISNVKCKNCNGDIIIKRSRDKSNEFCSTSCVGKFRCKEVEKIKCRFCNGEFIKSSKSKNIFCSKLCANKSRKVEYIRFCKRCGEEFTSNNIANINRGKDIYCSSSCSSRKYDINEHYFDKIDTQNKAYILGFIYADGCLSKNKSEVIIKLHHKDENILNIFKYEMKSEHPIKRITSYKNHQSSFRFSSKKIYKRLSDIGLTPAKTFTIKFPQIDKDFTRHFIRGYFDGDGCLYKGGKNRKLNFFNIFSASFDFKEGICDFLSQNKIEYKVYERDNGYSININKKESSSIFYTLIYSDANIYLSRKHEKYN
jgi:hypothetical protein